ncbi:MAG: acetyl-CoA C-acetyltransferase [Bacteroidia bacterium]
MTDAYIFDAIRTPRSRGKKGGTLHEVKPIELLVTLLNALQKRNQLDTAQVEDILLGCVTPIGEQGANLAKIAALYAGWSDSVAGVQLNRFCASGLEAVNLAAMKIRSGWADLIVAGGVESMSRVPMGSDGGAWFGDEVVSTKIHAIPQGISADLIATIEGFSREMVDKYACLSQQRAAFARENGYFKGSIIPIYANEGGLILAEDDFIRPSTTVETLAQLNPAFAEMGAQKYDEIAKLRYPNVQQINHVHHAGNSSGIVDGASLVLIGSLEKGKSLGLRPRAKIIAATAIGDEATIMLQGPAPASRKALKMANLTANDIDLYEMNEAFSAPVLKFQRELNLPDDKLNVNGGAIAMGHPLGATGAIILGTLLDELERQDKTLGLATLCVGGGMGVSTIIERV